MAIASESLRTTFTQRMQKRADPLNRAVNGWLLRRSVTTAALLLLHGLTPGFQKLFDSFDIFVDIPKQHILKKKSTISFDM